jgi:hypothetical protein
MDHLSKLLQRAAAAAMTTTMAVSHQGIHLHRSMSHCDGALIAPINGCVQDFQRIPPLRNSGDK